MLIWQKFKFGVFDVDGTLFDNMALCADAFLEIIKNFDLPNSPQKTRFDSIVESRRVRKIYLETNGMNLNDQFKLFFNKYGVKYNEALLKKLNKDFFDLRDNWIKWQNAPLFPGTETLLKTLRAKALKLFISSGSNTDEIIFRLKKAEIIEYFDLVLGGDKFPKGQKHIDLFAKFCGLTAQNFASAAFFISDGPNDMALAKKAGIFAIGITNTVDAEKLKAGGANLVISSTGDLKSLQF